MIPVIKYPAKSDWKELMLRPVIKQGNLRNTVASILKNVKNNGDKALKVYSKKLDGFDGSSFLVTKKEFLQAEKKIPADLKTAIGIAKENILKFHASQVEKPVSINTMPGVTCWRKTIAIEKTGFYIPGGSAPLFSTILMLAVPATIAGCREMILCTPPDPSGKIHPAILFTARLCGIQKVFKLGGAQAIAAMAYGTESVPKVQKIFGPGNQYVTCAKQIIQSEGTAIDMPAGPSELLIIADNTCIPEFIVADLLSQAEHGNDSQVILLSNSLIKVKEVLEKLEVQASGLSRKKVIINSLKKSKIILLKNTQEAIRFSNAYAPEHLIIACRKPEVLAEKIISAGSVFLGNYSPESAGDYASGTNHVLPTNGYAAMYSGVSTDSFVKKVTFQQISKQGLKNIGDTVMKLAAAEGLDAHERAVSVRLNKTK